jgi:hypothetical protein
VHQQADLEDLRREPDGPHAAPSPTSSVNHTCQAGGGESDAIRVIMPTVFIGGRS